MRWGIDHLRFRLRGATDENTEALLAEIKVLLAGVPERDIARLAPELLAGLLPRMYPQMIEEVATPSGRGPRDLHRLRGAATARRAARPRARHGGRDRDRATRSTATGC